MKIIAPCLLASGFLLFADVLPAAVAHSQEIGIPSGGRYYAQKNCAECHAVLKGETTSPNKAAPPFEDVARNPKTTSTLLTAWLQSSHPTMPNIVLGEDDKANVTAYILSLKDE